MPTFEPRWVTVEPEQFYHNTRQMAELVNAGYNAAAFEPALKAFEACFCTSPASYRTTSHPPEQRNLSVRYFGFGCDLNPYETAVAKGLITPNGHPIETLYDEAISTYPNPGHGVDLGTRNGLEKIWVLPYGYTPTEDAVQLPSLPEAARQHLGFFQKYGLDHLIVLGIDYLHKTINLYFTTPPEAERREKLLQMAQELGFTVGDEVETFPQLISVYFTFSWDSPKCVRMSAVTPLLTKDEFPFQYYPEARRYFENPPVLTEEPIAGFLPAYTANGNYFKIDMDYNGGLSQMLMMAVQGPSGE